MPNIEELNFDEEPKKRKKAEKEKQKQFEQQRTKTNADREAQLEGIRSMLLKSGTNNNIDNDSPEYRKNEEKKQKDKENKLKEQEIAEKRIVDTFEENKKLKQERVTKATEYKKIEEFYSRSKESESSLKLQLDTLKNSNNLLKEGYLQAETNLKNAHTKELELLEKDASRQKDFHDIFVENLKNSSQAKEKQAEIDISALQIELKQEKADKSDIDKKYKKLSVSNISLSRDHEELKLELQNALKEKENLNKRNRLLGLDSESKDKEIENLKLLDQDSNDFSNQLIEIITLAISQMNLKEKEKKKKNKKPSTGFTPEFINQLNRKEFATIYSEVSEGAQISDNEDVSDLKEAEKFLNDMTPSRIGSEAHESAKIVINALKDNKDPVTRILFNDENESASLSIEVLEENILNSNVSPTRLLPKRLENAGHTPSPNRRSSTGTVSSSNIENIIERGTKSASSSPTFHQNRLERSSSSDSIGSNNSTIVNKGLETSPTNLEKIDSNIYSPNGSSQLSPRHYQDVENARRSGSQPSSPNLGTGRS